MPTRIIKRNGGDDVVVELESFNYGGTLRERPVSLTGSLINKQKGGGTKVQAAVPVALIGTPGIADARPLNTNAGHLLATQFGGPNVPENIVPMYASFNQHGAWKSLEEKLRVLMESGAGRVTLSVNMSYGGTDPRIPSGFSAGATLATGAYVGLGFFPHLAPAVEHVAIAIEEVELIQLRQKQMVKEGWTMERANPNLKLPAPQVLRRYAVLDFMSDVTGDLKPQSITNAREFNDYQINNILTVNRANGLGYLHPDDPGDPFAGQQLLTVAGDQGPHVDHIVPRATMAGCNAYSNAQVLSGLGNMSKGSTNR